jgi:hypothetical protein
MLAPNIDNTITRFFAWPHPLLSRTRFIDPRDDDELFAAAMARLDAFGHVNVAENPDAIAELGTWLGRSLPLIRANERTTVPRRMRPDLGASLDPSTRGLLDHRSRIDVRVWSSIVRRVLPDADPAVLLEDAFAQAIDRYTEMLKQPPDALTLRRAVKIAYGAGVRLDPRRRRAKAAI